MSSAAQGPLSGRHTEVDKSCAGGEAFDTARWKPSGGWRTSVAIILTTDTGLGMRRQLLTELQRAARADFAAFFSLVRDESTPNGFRYADGCGHGDRDLLRSWGSMYAGAPVPSGAIGTVDPASRHVRKLATSIQQMPHRLRNRFRFLRSDVHMERAEDSDFLRTYYVDEEVGDQLRAVVYDGNVFLGWVGVLRRGARERFTKKEQAKLSRRMSDTLGVLRAAEVMSSGDVSETPGYVLFEHAGGRPLSVSQNLELWLSSERRAALGRHVRRHRPGTHENALVDGFRVAFTAMEGRDGMQVLAAFSPERPLRADAASSLTRSERRLAELSARGLTNAEAADLMSVSVNTVKTHLKRVYRKLEVTSRAELATVIVGADGTEPHLEG